MRKLLIIMLLAACKPSIATEEIDQDPEQLAKSGYVVLPEGDTLRGYINLEWWKGDSCPNTIGYVSIHKLISASDTPRVFTPNLARGFGFCCGYVYSSTGVAFELQR